MYLQSGQYTAYIKDDLLGKCRSSIGALRLGFLIDVPEASDIVRHAESVAYDYYDTILAGIVKYIDYQKQEATQRNQERQREGNAQNLEHEDRNANLEQELAICEVYKEEYREYGRRYCFNLKFCYPMYALHHVNVLMREGVVPPWGYFHCPCGIGCSFWRKMRCGMDMYRQRVHEEDDKNHPDYCGDGEGAYDSLQGLVMHLKEKKFGALHQSALAFLLNIYFEEQLPIPPGAVAVDVDSGVAVKLETGEPVVVDTWSATTSARETVPYRENRVLATAVHPWRLENTLDERKPAARSTLNPPGFRWDELLQNPTSVGLKLGQKDTIVRENLKQEEGTNVTEREIVDLFHEEGDEAVELMPTAHEGSESKKRKCESEESTGDKN